MHKYRQLGIYGDVCVELTRVEFTTAGPERKRDPPSSRGSQTSKIAYCAREAISHCHRFLTVSAQLLDLQTITQSQHRPSGKL